MPTQIVQQFTTNIVNQVIKAGEQDLTTIQSGELLKSVEVESTKVIESHPTKEAEEPAINLTNESNTILNSL